MKSLFQLQILLRELKSSRISDNYSSFFFSAMIRKSQRQSASKLNKDQTIQPLQSSAPSPPATRHQKNSPVNRPSYSSTPFPLTSGRQEYIATDRPTRSSASLPPTPRPAKGRSPAQQRLQNRSKTNIPVAVGNKSIDEPAEQTSQRTSPSLPTTKTGTRVSDRQRCQRKRNTESL